MHAGSLAIIAASLLWGTTGTAATFFSDGVSPLAIGAVTMVVGGGLLFAVGARDAVRALRDRSARRWLLIGSAGVFAYPLAFYSSMDLAGVAVGNVVSLGSGPLFAAILEWVWERQRLSTRWLISTAIAIAGVAMLSVGGHADSSDGSTDVVPGVLLGFVAGFSYALFTYASTRAIRCGHSGGGVMGGLFGVGAVWLLPVLAITGAPLVASWQNVGVAAYLALGPMFLAYVLFGAGLRSVRSSAATTITLVEPLVATVLAVVVVGERLTTIGWLGLGAILVGVAVLTSARRGRESVVPPYHSEHGG